MENAPPGWRARYGSVPPLGAPLGFIAANGFFLILGVALDEAAMRAFTDQRDADTPDELWLCEHDPVYTQGIAGRSEHVLSPEGIPVVRTNRGGQGITNIVTSERNGPVVASFPAHNGEQLMLVTDQGKLIRTVVNTIRIAGRATQGVTLFKVADDEQRSGAAGVHEAQRRLHVALAGEQRLERRPAEPAHGGEAEDPRGERLDHVEELQERAGPAVGEDQRGHVRPGAADVHEVDVLAVDARVLQCLVVGLPLRTAGVGVGAREAALGNCHGYRPRGLGGVPGRGRPASHLARRARLP